MALYAFDGTWNDANTSDLKDDTNVVRFCQAYEGQVHYLEGVGTRLGRIGAILGGIFGAGGRTRIEEMYDMLTTSYQAGDRSIDIIGFSRGAALAVHFANVVAKRGIKDNTGTEIASSPQIRFLGVWDIVGSFGVPIDVIVPFQDINLGWDIDEVPEQVMCCRHAIAIDENRQVFDVTRLKKASLNGPIQERWFRGRHGDVGGGNGNRPLSANPLKWMFDQAQSVGISIKPGSYNKASQEIQLYAAISSPDMDVIEQPRRPRSEADILHESSHPRSIEVGETHRFEVNSAVKYNWSGLLLDPGSHYQFNVDPGAFWQDKEIICGAEGWKTEELPFWKETIVRPLEGLRRLPEANWFELIGSIGETDKQLFRIGTKLTKWSFPGSQAEVLFCFANDLEFMYGNNVGEIWVTVTRVA